jgi:hypothetical protein
VVEHLPSKLRALSSNSTTAEKKNPKNSNNNNKSTRKQQSVNYTWGTTQMHKIRNKL